MIVGYMGSIPFLTSRKYLMTFHDYARNAEGRWAKHEIIGQKPAQEFLGPGSETVTFTITLRRDHGVPIETMLNQMRKMRDTGEVFPLVLGTKVIGSLLKSLIFKTPFNMSNGLWILKKMDEKVAHRAGGNIYVMDVDVTLEEYGGRLL